MQIQTKRLRETLGLLKPVTPVKSLMPMIENVLLTDGKAIATDLETMVILDLPEAEGEYLIPHRLVSELVKRIPEQELTIEQKQMSLTITWQGGTVRYEVPDIGDYLPVPEVEPAIHYEVNGDELVRGLGEVVDYCVRKDDMRPVLTGVSIVLGGESFVASGDGFRLAYCPLSIFLPEKVILVIPKKSVHILKHLWGKLPPLAVKGDIISQVVAPREIGLTISGAANKRTRLMAAFGQVTLISDLIEGSIPNWPNLIPKECGHGFRVFAPDLLRAVHSAKNIDANFIRLIWDENTLTLSTSEAEKGNLQITIPVEGTPGKVALNPDYLSCYLAQQTGFVTLETNGPDQPVVFRNSTPLVVVIMPINVAW